MVRIPKSNKSNDSSASGGPYYPRNDARGNIDLKIRKIKNKSPSPVQPPTKKAQIRKPQVISAYPAFTEHAKRNSNEEEYGEELALQQNTRTNTNSALPTPYNSTPSNRRRRVPKVGVVAKSVDKLQHQIDVISSGEEESTSKKFSSNYPR